MKVALSTGWKESSLRPSKPGPNSIRGEPPAQEPRSPVTVASALLVCVEVEEEAVSDVAAGAAAAVAVEAAFAAEVPVETEPPADATA